MRNQNTNVARTVSMLYESYLEMMEDSLQAMVDFLDDPAELIEIQSFHQPAGLLQFAKRVEEMSEEEISKLKDILSVDESQRSQSITEHLGRQISNDAA